jgi:hypothetical protein
VDPPMRVQPLAVADSQHDGNHGDGAERVYVPVRVREREGGRGGEGKRQ